MLSLYVFFSLSSFNTFRCCAMRCIRFCLHSLFKMSPFVNVCVCAFFFLLFKNRMFGYRMVVRFAISFKEWNENKTLVINGKVINPWNVCIWVSRERESKKSRKWQTFPNRYHGLKSHRIEVDVFFIQFFPLFVFFMVFVSKLNAVHELCFVHLCAFLSERKEEKRIENVRYLLRCNLNCQ